jgi:hypothetical protein
METHSKASIPYFFKSTYRYRYYSRTVRYSYCTVFFVQHPLLFLRAVGDSLLLNRHRRDHRRRPLPSRRAGRLGCRAGGWGLAQLSSSSALRVALCVRAVVRRLGSDPATCLCAAPTPDHLAQFLAPCHILHRFTSAGGVVLDRWHLRRERLPLGWPLRLAVLDQERRERLLLRVAPLLRLGHSAQGGARAGAEKGPCGAAHSAQ